MQLVFQLYSGFLGLWRVCRAARRPLAVKPCGISSACAGDLNERAKQCSSESAARGKRKRQSKRPSIKRGIMQIPPIKITNTGETYFINRATDSTYAEKKTRTWKYHKPTTGTNEPTHHQESWTVATSSKKCKVTPFASGRKTETLEKKTMASGYQTA